MPLKHLAHYAKLSLRILICPHHQKVGISSLCVFVVGAGCSMEESV